TRWPRDWSSDVCSSDLAAKPGRFLGKYGNRAAALIIYPAVLAAWVYIACVGAGLSRRWYLLPFAYAIAVATAVLLRRFGKQALKIGRASCRERVWSAVG